MKKEMTIVERAKAPTPRFFKKLRNIGLILGALGGAIVTAPVALPAIVATVAGYIGLAGGVITSVSQLAVHGETPARKKK